MATAAHNASIQAYTTAITRLLLGDRPLSDGVAIAAGKPLDLAGRIEIATMAVEADGDLVHLALRQQADGTTSLAGIMLVTPRDGVCHISTECRLWLAKGATRAVILPQPHVCGHYRLTPHEILHTAKKPLGDIAAGTQRAKTKLDQLVRACPSLPKGMTLFNLRPGKRI